MFTMNLLSGRQYFAESDDTGVADPPVDPSEEKAGKGGLMNDLLKERAKRKELEKELTAARKKAEEAERAELTEVEQLKAKLAEAEAKAAATEADRVKANRADILRRAAAKADFADAEDVVALARGLDQLDDIETDSDAERYVKALAKEKPHLVRAQTISEELDLSKVSTMEKVLKDGLSEGASEKDKKALADMKVIPPGDLAAMSNEAQIALKRSNPDLYWRSIEALSTGPETTHTIH